MLTLKAIQGVEALRRSYSASADWQLYTLTTTDPAIRDGLFQMAEGLRWHAVACCRALTSTRPHTAFARVAWRDQRAQGIVCEVISEAGKSRHIKQTLKWERGAKGAYATLNGAASLVESVYNGHSIWAYERSNDKGEVLHGPSHESYLWRLHSMAEEAWPILLGKPLANPAAARSAHLGQPGRAYLRGLSYGFSAMVALPKVLQVVGKSPTQPSCVLPVNRLECQVISPEKWAAHWRNNRPAAR